MLSAPSVLGQPQAVSQEKKLADALFERAKKAIAKEDWELGCQLFRESQEHDPSPSTLVKLARCDEHAGESVLAWNDYEAAKALLLGHAADDRHAKALEELILKSQRELELRLGKVELTLEPAVGRAALSLDGAEPSSVAQQGPSLLVCEPGPHRLDVSAPGYQPETTSFAAVAGETHEILLTLAPHEAEPAAPSVVAPAAPTGSRSDAPRPRAAERMAQGSAPAAAPQPSAGAKRTAAPTASTNSDAPEDARLGTRKAGAIAALGGGGIVLGAAVYWGIQSASIVQDSVDSGECDADYRCSQDGLDQLDEARRAQTTSIALGVVGVAAISAGAVLWFGGGEEGAAGRSPTPRAALHLGPRGVSVEGRW